ncbi:MAG: M20 metallopeptidase family protein [Mycobacterium leprae]
MEREALLSLAQSVQPYVLETRRHLHAHPELSYQETETAAFIARELERMGYPVRTGVGGLHGVVAEAVGKRSGPTIALRADIDALPVSEQGNLPFRSQTPGVMHACGHDCHTAMLLGTALALKQLEPELAGKVLFIFQPAEEVGPGGAQAMVQAGILEEVDAVFALHVSPALETGRLGFVAGVCSANSDGMRITITGKGGHAAHPENAVDAVVVAGHVIVALQQVVSRGVAPTQEAVVTIGAIHGGTKGNIIAEQVELAGTIRTLDRQVRSLVHQKVHTIVSGICAAYSATSSVEIRPGYPSCVNDSAMVALARAAAASMVGEPNVLHSEVSLEGEDFAYMLQAVPGCTGLLGIADAAWPQEQRAPLHNSRLMVDEAALLHGVGFYLSLVDLAGREGSPLAQDSSGAGRTRTE